MVLHQNHPTLVSLCDTVGLTHPHPSPPPPHHHHHHYRHSVIMIYIYNSNNNNNNNYYQGDSAMTCKDIRQFLPDAGVHPGLLAAAGPSEGHRYGDPNLHDQTHGSGLGCPKWIQLGASEATKMASGFINFIRWSMDQWVKLWNGGVNMEHGS